MDAEFLALIQYVLLNSDKFYTPRYQKGEQFLYHFSHISSCFK
jgi:hypothetical protein